MTVTAAKAPGRLLAWTALLVALVASVAANVAYALPALGPRLSSGVAPVLVILAAGLLERVPLAGVRLWRRLLAYFGLGLVIVAAFVTSFDHQRRLLLRYGNQELSAVLLPVAVDGLIVFASVCLTVIAERRREVDGSAASTESKIDSVRMFVEQGDVAAPADVPLTARIPAVALSALRRTLADSGADNDTTRGADIRADTTPVTATAIGADSNPDSAADVQVPDSPDTTADTTAPRKRTSGRTPGRTETRSRARTTGRTSGRTAKADIPAAARQLRDRHPEWAVADIARRLGVTDRTVRRHINGTTKTEGTAP